MYACKQKTYGVPLVPHFVAAELLNPIRIYPKAKQQAFSKLLERCIEFLEASPHLLMEFHWGLFVANITLMQVGSDYAGYCRQN